MKYLKTYESFSDERNVVKRFTQEEILYLLQEITDDIEINMHPEVDIIELDCKPYEEGITPEIIDMNGNFHLISPISDNPNCYMVELDVPDSMITKARKQIEEIMDEKATLYGVQYLLSDQLMFEGGAINHYDWRILIY